MADYHPDRRHVPRPNQEYGGPSSNMQRDAAFTQIFGGAPPPGRTQTMTSSSGHPDMSAHPQQYAQQRPPPQQAPVQDRFPRPQSMALPPPHDYDDDVSEVSSDEEERHRPGDRRVQSQHSFGKPPPQQQKRRFRMSLFG